MYCHIWGSLDVTRRGFTFCSVFQPFCVLCISWLVCSCKPMLNTGTHFFPVEVLQIWGIKANSAQSNETSDSHSKDYECFSLWGYVIWYICTKVSSGGKCFLGYMMSHPRNQYLLENEPVYSSARLNKLLKLANHKAVQEQVSHYKLTWFLQ